MARIEVQEPRDERMIVIIGQPEAKHAAIERHQLIDRLRGIDVEHDMAQAERAGTKTRDRAPGPEWFGRGLGAVEQFEPVAKRIVEHDQVAHVAFVGQRAGAARHLDLVFLQMRRDGVERRRIGDLPAEKADALAAVGGDDDALLAVVHAEGERRARLVDALQAEQARAVARPVGQILGAHADIAQSLRSRTHGKPHDICHPFTRMA